MPLKSGPSSACQRNAIEMAFLWCADNGPTIECWLGGRVIFRGSRSILLRNPIFLRFFRGGPDPLSSPSGSAKWMLHSVPLEINVSARNCPSF